jgi:hypothetical protein
MKRIWKPVPIIIAAALGIMIGSAVTAGPLENMQGALVFLQKARMTADVQIKTRNLVKAKEQLTVAAYDGGGHRAAALVLTTQAIGSVNEFNLDRANRQIDMAIVKVKHAVQAKKQETAAKMKQGMKKK